jgi:DNA-binding CsgD family transcriptional regulator
MGEMSAGGARTMLEVAHIASAPGGVVQRAEALLEPLRRLIRFDAAYIALLHPQRREHLALVRHGYDQRTTTFLDTPALMDDIELLGLDRTRPPMRVTDFTAPPEEIQSWAEYLRPAGFREGMAVGLFTPDGRYLGILGLSTASPVPPSDAVRDLAGTLAPLIAAAVDPLRSVAAVAGIIRRAAAGVVLTRDGAVLPLPGLPGHPLLVAGSAVLTLAAGEFAEGDAHLAFLCPSPTEPGGEGQVRVTVLATPVEAPSYLCVIVVVSPPGDLHGLTRRELEVLGLLVEGRGNQRIAADLLIAERTVAAHVEHILVKLAVPSRAAAAVTALRLGLFVPPALRPPPP